MGGNNSKQKRENNKNQQPTYYWAPNDDGKKEPEKVVDQGSASNENKSTEQTVLNDQNQEQHEEENAEEQNNIEKTNGEEEEEEREEEGEDNEELSEPSLNEEDGEDQEPFDEENEEEVLQEEEIQIQDSKDILKLAKELQTRDNNSFENEIRFKNIITQNYALSDKYSESKKQIKNFRESDEITRQNMCEVILRNKKLRMELQIMVEKKQEGENIFQNEITQIIRDERVNAAQVKLAINRHRDLNNKKLTYEEEIKRKQIEIERLYALVEDKRHEVKNKRKQNFIVDKAYEMMEKEKIIKDHIFQMIRKEIKERNKEILDFQPIMYFQATFYKMEYEIENAFRNSFGDKENREIEVLHRYIREKDEEIKNFATLISNERRDLENIRTRNDEIKNQILAYKSILDG